MPSLSAELLLIITRAASPIERAGGEWFEPLPVQPPGTIEKRTLQWINTVTGGDKEVFEQYLKARGLSHEAFVRAISEGTVNTAAQLPEWGKVFLEIMESFASIGPEALAPPQPSQRETSNPFYAVLLPFRQIAAAELRKKISSLDLSISDRAEAQLLYILVARLSYATIHVVDNEMQTALATSSLMKQLGITPRPHLDGSLTGWMDRFSRYPVLARMVSVVLKNWRNYVFELLERLAQDRALLEEQLFAGQPLGTLEGVIGDAGDLHDQGRAVALLVFSGGSRLAYKPKDLRISIVFLNLVSLLNSLGPEMTLHFRRIFHRGQYAWEEWVEHQPCGSAEEVDSFYFRMGMVVRLLQLLGARDFWLDNLIACGGYPVFIDLEMAFQQTMALPTQLLPAEQIAFAKLIETIVPMGAITMVTPIGQGLKAEDLGALTPVREFQTPFKFSYSSPMMALLAPHLKKNDNTRWYKTDYTPVLDGRPALAADYLDRVIAGYKSMNGFLIANRPALLSETGPFKDVGDFPLRHITRDTWSCLRIINDSLRTALLVDGFQRELFFEGLMRVAVDGNRPSAQLIKVLESEIQSLRDLDVPLFRALPSQTKLLLSNGGEIPGYFSETSISRIMDRIRALDDFAVNEHCDFIRSSFATGPHKAWRSQRANGGSRRPAPTREFWLEEAIKLGDFILAQSLRSGEGDLAWLGLIYHPDIDLRSLDVLRPDLLSGTCGLSVLFSGLYEMTGMDRFRDAARGALVTTERSIHGDHPLFKVLGRTGPSRSRFIASGGYFGMGGQFYALRRCAEALNAPDLDKTITAYLDLLPLAELCEHSHIDLISGLAGLLLSILPFHGAALTDPALPVASVLAEYLLDLCQQGNGSLKDFYPENVSLREGLPDLFTGLALCFARLEKSIVSPPLEPLRNRIAPAITALEALKPPDVVRRPCLWASLSIRHLLGQPYDDLLERVKEQTIADPSQLNSQRLLDLLETALTAFRITQNEQFLGCAKKTAFHLIEWRFAGGSWFPDSFAADRHNLSAMHGIGAIASYFMCLSRPERIRSIRGLE